jgi:hypothetical protein
MNSKGHYLSYYPNYIEHKNNFLKHLKNTEGFKDFCLGKDEWFYKNENNFGKTRNRDHLTEDERIDRDYLWNEFKIWSDWRQAGKNIFAFSEGLLNMLKETDVSQTDLQSIYLPYPYFYIDISEAKIPFEKNGDIFLQGVYIHEKYNNEKVDDVTYEKVIGLNFTGEYIENFESFNSNLYNFSRGFHSYSLYLDRPYNVLTVGDAVKDAKDLFESIDVYEGLSQDEKEKTIQIHSDFIDRTVKIVINCLLYLTLKDKDIFEEYPEGLPANLLQKYKNAPSKRKKEVAQQAIRIAGFTKIKLIGKTFSNSHFNHTGTMSTHWRRGHWRNQRSGLDLKTIELKWIKPTIVNKDLGIPEKGHIYTN